MEIGFMGTDDMLTGIQYGVGGAVIGGGAGMVADSFGQGGSAMMPAGAVGGGAAGYVLGSGAVGGFIIGSMVIMLVLLLVLSMSRD